MPAFKGTSEDGGSSSPVIISSESGGATGLQFDLPVRLGTVTIGGVVTVGAGGSIARTGQNRILNARAKVGAGAGWVLGGADNLAVLATMAASQTAGTLVIPVSGLKVGDIITGFGLSAQIESAGGTVTIDAELRKLLNVAAEPTDSSIGSIVQVSVIADTASNPSKAALAETVVRGSGYYILVTATTGASCDIQLLSADVTVTES